MNRRTFTASLAGLLGVVGMGAKAKAAPNPVRKRPVKIERYPFLASWSGTFTANLPPPIYPLGTVHSQRTPFPPVSTPPAPEA